MSSTCAFTCASPTLQDKSILELAAELGRLQAAAAANKLAQADTSGGTLTLSNIGSIGGTYATPLVNPPEASARLPPCLAACPPACLPVCLLPARVPAVGAERVSVGPPRQTPACPPACLPACPPAHLLACLLACLAAGGHLV